MVDFNLAGFTSNAPSGYFTYDVSAGGSVEQFKIYPWLAGTFSEARYQGRTMGSAAPNVVTVLSNPAGYTVNISDVADPFGLSGTTKIAALYGPQGQYIPIDIEGWTNSPGTTNLDAAKAWGQSVLFPTAPVVAPPPVVAPYVAPTTVEVPMVDIYASEVVGPDTASTAASMAWLDAYLAAHPELTMGPGDTPLPPTVTPPATATESPIMGLSLPENFPWWLILLLLAVALYSGSRGRGKRVPDIRVDA